VCIGRGVLGGVGGGLRCCMFRWRLSWRGGQGAVLCDLRVDAGRRFEAG
jgi:hypothetical protein